MKIIGIAGGTGSGKTTLAYNLKSALGSERCVIVSHDNYYRDQSSMTMEERLSVNYDHPDSIETELLVEHLGMLRNNQSIDIPTYDFVNYTRDTPTYKIEPKEFLILEGIMILVDERLRNMLDYKVFLEVEADVRLMRRIRRDVIARQRTWKRILKDWEERARPMHLQFVEPSSKFADQLVQEGGENKEAIEKIASNLMVYK